MAVEPDVGFAEQLGGDGQVDLGRLGVDVPQERREGGQPALQVHPVAIPRSRQRTANA